MRNHAVFSMFQACFFQKACSILYMCNLHKWLKWGRKTSWKSAAQKNEDSERHWKNYGGMRQKNDQIPTKIWDLCPRRVRTCEFWHFSDKIDTNVWLWTRWTKSKKTEDWLRNKEKQNDNFLKSIKTIKFRKFEIEEKGQLWDNLILFLWG